MSKNYLTVMRKSGIKLTRLAEKMGMGESLLRYYLEQKRPSKDIEDLFFKKLDEMIAETRVGLECVRRTS